MPPHSPAPRVAIIGTGFGGIAMAVRLLEDGVDDIVLLERYEDTGGTWRDNTYPGAACDIPSHLYSLSFAPKSDWSRRYATQPEIRAYMDDVVARYGIRPRTRFGFDVRACTWDDDTATWTLRSAKGEQVEADVIVNAIGGLKDPKYPSIEGLESFEGPVMHSARWDHDVDTFGARVGVIGTGASSVQVVPELAERTSQLTVFQRTAPWVVPKMDGEFSAAQKRVFAYVPGARAAYRTRLFLEHELFRSAFTEGTPLNVAGQALSRAHLLRQVPNRELRRTLTPDYTFGCKRVLRSDDYYPALTRSNVAVETDGIARVEPDGVVLEDGRKVELDVLVLCTGFKVDDPLNGTVVTGRDGVDLDAFWDGRPSAHNTVAVPGFPNMYMLLGPNGALGHNSVVLMIEAAVEYVRDAIHQMRSRDLVSIEVTARAHREFVQWVDAALDGSSWSGGCASWYLNAAGENFTVWPGDVRSYQRTLQRIDLAEHHVRRRSALPERNPAEVFA